MSNTLEVSEVSEVSEVGEVGEIEEVEATKASEIGKLEKGKEPKASENVEALPFPQNTDDSDEFRSVASCFSMNTFHTAASRIDKHDFKTSLHLQWLLIKNCKEMQIAKYQIETAITRKPWRGRISGLSTLLSSKTGPGMVST